MLMDFFQDIGQGYGADWRGIIFRETYPNLEDVIAKSEKWFPRLHPGSRFNASKYYWYWPTGERLYLRHAAKPKDYWKYHGHEYPFVGWEELTNWPDDELYMTMMSVCRSSNPDVPRRYQALWTPGPVKSACLRMAGPIPWTRGLDRRSIFRAGAPLCRWSRAGGPWGWRIRLQLGAPAWTAECRRL